MMPKFPALPPASLRVIQRLKTKLYANESLMLAGAVAFSQTDESGDHGDSLLCEEREEEELGIRTQETVIYMQFAFCLMWQR